WAALLRPCSGAKSRRSLTPRMAPMTCLACVRSRVTEAWCERRPTVRPRRRDDSREASTSRPDRTAAMDPYSRVGSDTMARIRYDRLPTERPNPRSRGLDRLGPGGIARLMNRADADAVKAVGPAAPGTGRGGGPLRG